MLILATSWYIFKAKFNVEVYQQWIINFLFNVKKFKLVIFTNEESKWMIEPFLLGNNNIKMVLLEIEDFYGFQFKDQWIENHTKNYLLNKMVDWRVNMLWSEKITFVKHVIDNNYFRDDLNKQELQDDTWFGWCDIGYFRGGPTNMDINRLREWPSNDKLNSLEINKIYYNQVCTNDTLNAFAKIILNKDERNNLPIEPIPPSQASIAGGFFLIKPEKINWWKNVYYERLARYFEHNYLVKDDQIIIVDCIINHLSEFKRIKETDHRIDSWFAFSNYLLI